MEVHQPKKQPIGICARTAMPMTVWQGNFMVCYSPYLDPNPDPNPIPIPNPNLLGMLETGKISAVEAGARLKLGPH